MIATVLMVSLRRLLHNRIELLLAFVVPIAFFSIFAIIFGGGVGAGNTPKIKVVAVDTVKSVRSVAIMSALREIVGLRFVRNGSDANASLDASTTEILTEAQANEMVRHGTAAIAIVLRNQAGGISADLLSDTSDQVAPQIVSALVQRVLMSGPMATGTPREIEPEALAENVDRNINRTARGSASASGSDHKAIASAQESGLRGQDDQANKPLTLTLSPGYRGEGTGQSQSLFVPPPVRIIDVLSGSKTNPVVSMYAAGIAVMFLLFGATGGGGALLEERENQTLDRLLTTGLTMDQLLLGKWFYLTGLGIVQTSVMFLWGQLVFGVDLLGHIDGFVIMTAVTAGAAAAFGLLLATLCRTRGQLNGLSVVVVLTMSALGGSMVPRYVMSQSLRDAGLWTFNAWALDGYDKVFWRELPVAELWPQMSVLMICGTVFLVTARIFAIRWETD